MKKYLADILILIGVWIFASVSWFPVQIGGVKFTFGNEAPDFSNYFKLLAIVFISIGIDIAIRKRSSR